ncbi:MAG: LysR family transcriptional regulator [Hyphomicrobiaceae bacterium]|nr:LysR family transcriptional regulator [Hyphomicrobiaceae bacterium]
MTAITDLEIFARVARTGNMSAAGREMGLSPAVVSKRVSLLEDRLNTRLFQRTTRQLTLTETGEGYFRRVVDILNLIEEAENFVNRRNTTPRGLLKVTAPTSFSRLHIAPYLPAFLKKFPEIELEFHLTDNFVDIIREGFDVAIRIGELQDSSLVQRKLAADTRVICASPSYLAGTELGAPKSLADLDFHNCLSAGAQDYWRLEGADGQHQLRVKGNIRSNSFEFMREALLAGLGLGLRSIWDVGPELRRGALEVVLPEYRGSSNVAIYAVYPCRDFMPEKVNVFIEYLAALYGPEPYWNEGLDLAALLGSAQPKATGRKAASTATGGGEIAAAARALGAMASR